MSAHDPSAPRSGARILNFRRRPGAAAPPRPAAPEQDVVEDLSKYTRDETPDDYRHRMTVNLVAFVFVAVLAGIGYWLADTMATQRKNQDCVLAGRKNCTQVDIPVEKRF